MLQDNRSFAQPFRAGGADKIHFHHVEHAGAKIVGQAARLEHHQRQYRQHQMGGDLQHILPAAVVAAGIIMPPTGSQCRSTANHLMSSRQRKKGRERHGGEHRDAHQMIERRIGLQR